MKMFWKTFILTIKLKGFAVTCLPPSERNKYTSRFLTSLAVLPHHFSFKFHLSYLLSVYSREMCYDQINWWEVLGDPSDRWSLSQFNLQTCHTFHLVPHTWNGLCLWHSLLNLRTTDRIFLLDKSQKPAVLRMKQITVYKHQSMDTLGQKPLQQTNRSTDNASSTCLIQTVCWGAEKNTGNHAPWFLIAVHLKRTQHCPSTICQQKLNKQSKKTETEIFRFHNSWPGEKRNIPQKRVLHSKDLPTSDSSTYCETMCKEGNISEATLHSLKELVLNNSSPHLLTRSDTMTANHYSGARVQPRRIQGKRRRNSVGVGEWFRERDKECCR